MSVWRAAGNAPGSGPTGDETGRLLAAERGRQRGGGGGGGGGGGAAGGPAPPQRGCVKDEQANVMGGPAMRGAGLRRDGGSLISGRGGCSRSAWQEAAPERGGAASERRSMEPTRAPACARRLPREPDQNAHSAYASCAMMSMSRTTMYCLSFAPSNCRRGRGREAQAYVSFRRTDAVPPLLFPSRLPPLLLPAATA